ncbi:MAG: ABC transporter substrate-binding protein [Pseudomonadota bacterium]
MKPRQILSFVFLLFAVLGISDCFAQRQPTPSAMLMPIVTPADGRDTNQLPEEAKGEAVQRNESKAGLKHVTLQLTWLHQFQFAGYYASVEKGFYRDAGFDVAIVEGTSDKRPIKEVVSGRANYGVAKAELLLNRLHGQPVVALAAIIQHSAIIMLAKKESGISSPQDMIGKRVMLRSGDDAAEYLAMFKSEGVSLDKVNIIPSTYNIDDLIDGKTDVFNAYITNEPYYLEQKGIHESIISPITYGIDFYGDCLFTSEQEMNNHPDQVRAFRAASLRGWEYAMAHPEEIIDVIVGKYSVKKSRDHLQFEAAAMRKLMLPDLIEMGHMNPGRWQHMADTYVVLGMADSGYSLEGFIYNPNPTPDYSWVSRVLGIVTSVLILISLGFFILLRFNKKLRLEVAQRKQVEERLGKARNELEIRVEERTAELTKANEQLNIENSERKRAEEEITWNLAINQALSSLYIPLVTPGATIEQISEIILEKSRQLTGSPHGFVNEIDPATGDQIAHTLTKMMYTECTVAEEQLRKVRFPQRADGLYNGLGGYALNTKEPFYTDVPAEHPASVGIPEGHITIERFLAVPVLLAGELVGQIALSNSTRAYTDRDLDAINRIAEFYALAIQHKRAEEEIRQLNQGLEQRVIERTAKLEAANKELDAFAYSVSHDLRAPLRHIDGFLGLLGKCVESGLDDQGRHYMTAITDTANHMGVLIDELLSFSRMGRQEMCTTQVDLGLLVQEVIREQEPDTQGREIQWRVADLPVVAGDQAMLKLVLVNLIANALKFTQPRQQTVIEIGLLPGKDSETVIYVRDNGVGFDMTYMDKLFGVFKRLHRADEFEGTGIGLATVRRIIARHGGRTWAEGQPDQGASFFFSLP